MNKTIILLDDAAIAVSTSCKMKFSQKAIPVMPFPGNSDDDGWEHFRAGDIEWELDNESFFCEYSSFLIGSSYSGVLMSVIAELSDNISLSGNAYIESVKLESAVNSLSKLEVKFSCDGFPSININQS